MKSYNVELNSGEIKIKEYAGEKGPIIMIHGLTGNHLNMRYYADYFAGGYKVISVDLQGRGDSGEMKKNSSIFTHADNILELINKQDYKDIILVGYSMGAYIASIIASKSSLIKKLVLLDGTAAVDSRHDDIVKPSLSRLSKKYKSKEDYVNEVRTIYKRLNVKWSEELKETIEYEVEKKNDFWKNKSNESTILSDWDSFRKFDSKEIIKKIKCPIFLIYAHGKIGSEKPLFLVEEYEKTLQYANNIKTLDTSCNHYTMVFENQKVINKAIEQFLEN